MERFHVRPVWGEPAGAGRCAVLSLSREVIHVQGRILIFSHCAEFCRVYGANARSTFYGRSPALALLYHKPSIARTEGVLELLLYIIKGASTIIAYPISRKFRENKEKEWKQRPSRKYIDLGISGACLMLLLALVAVILMFESK